MIVSRPPIYTAIDGAMFGTASECLAHEAEIGFCDANAPLRFDKDYKPTKTMNNPKYIVCYTAKQVKYAMMAWNCPQPAILAESSDEEFDNGDGMVVFMYEHFKDGDSYIELYDYIDDIQGEINAAEKTAKKWQKEKEEYTTILTDLEMTSEEELRKSAAANITKINQPTEVETTAITEVKNNESNDCVQMSMFENDMTTPTEEND